MLGSVHNVIQLGMDDMPLYSALMDKRASTIIEADRALVKARELPPDEFGGKLRKTSANCHDCGNEKGRLELSRHATARDMYSY